jgi:hypothetical protein
MTNTGQHVAYSNEMGNLQLIPGVLRGYRGWRWDESTGRLISTGWFHPWNMSHTQPDATCLRTDELAATIHRTAKYRSPVQSCSCGYYASYHPVGYMLQAELYWTGYMHGTVSAHGRIVLGTGGFRAQRIRLDAMWGQASEYAASLYDVPWFRTQDSMLAEFPPCNLSQLLQYQQEVEHPDPPMYDEFSNPLQP